MSPRNSDFEYEGLKVENAGGFNARDYHNRTQKPVEPTKKQRVQPQGLGLAGRQTNLYDHQKQQIENAAMKDWRNRGLSDNKIIDN